MKKKTTINNKYLLYSLVTKNVMIKMEKLKNITPGKILQEEFLIPMGISQYRLSKELNIPQTRISGIINGSRRITADTALRLSLFFGNSAKFWLGLQNDYDIENAENVQHEVYEQIKCFA